MHVSPVRLALDGAIAGVLAGVTVSLWFLGLDIVNGVPLATPRALVGVLLGQDPATVGVAGLAGYTVLHFSVFAVLGIGATLFLSAVGIEPKLRHGIVFGAAVLDAAYYSALLALGAPDIASVLPAVHVVAANVLGGMVCMAYLHRAQRVDGPLGLASLKDHPMLAEGLGLGLSGAVAVALWFLLLDIVRGSPLFTPAALGSAVFLGASGPSEVSVTFGMVLAYSALHIIVFCAIGVAITFVAGHLELAPGHWLVVVMAIITLDAGFIGVAGMMGTWVLGAIGLWAVIVGNLLGAATMGFLVWRWHPELRIRLLQQPVTTQL